MNDKLEKAQFYVETEEHDKAEELFSELFDEDNSNTDAILGIVRCKAIQSDFEKNNFKACNAYLNRIDEHKLSNEQRQELVSGILAASEAYLKKVLKNFRDHALELTKRPALDGQLYAVKQLGDTTDYMGYINDNIGKLEGGFNYASKAYNLAKYNKEDVAYEILKLYDLVFKNFRETPQMTGKTLLEASALLGLKDDRQAWLSKSGEHKTKVTADPSDSSGCMVLLIALTSIATTILSLMIMLI